MRVLVILLTTFLSSACFGQTQSASNQAQSPSDDQGAANAQKVEKQREQIILTLFTEMDNLIPGEFTDDSPRKKAVMDAAIAYQQGKGGEVNRILKEESKKDPTFPPVELLTAGLSYVANDVNTGKILLESASKNNPQYPGIYTSFARLAISEGRTTDAMALLEKAGRIINATELTPVEKTYFKTQYFDAMVDVTMRREEFTVAREHLQSLKQLDPDTVKIPKTLAELEFHRGDIESSLRYLKEYKSKLPTAGIPELVLASWYQIKGNDIETGKWVKAAADKYPTDVRAQLEQANYAVSQENFALANNTVGRIEKLTGENATLTLIKAKLAFAGESYGVAEMHYEKLYTNNPRSFDAANMYALALIESKSAEKQALAVQIAERNLRQIPTNPIAQASLGWVYMRIGKADKAKQLIASAARTPDMSSEVAFFIASFLHRNNQSEQAAKVLEPIVNKKGFFHYRAAAKRLLKEAQSAGSLPAPSK